MSQSVEWAYWVKLPEVKVFEALALLHNTEPGGEPPDGEDASLEYRKALRLLLACLSDRVAFTPGTKNLGDPALHGVRLPEVGAWARTNGYTLPDKFPRPVVVSKAPPPITPLRGIGSAPSSSPSPAIWNKWKFIPKCELWKAVCLTLDIEPNEEKHNMVSWLQSRRGVPFGFPADFADRLQIAEANVSTHGPIQPQNLYVGVLNNPHAEVLLSEVGAAAIRWGWTLPECMKALARSGEPVTTPKPSATKFPPMVPATDLKPWLLIEPSDPTPEHGWYTPARYFARQLVLKDSTLLTKKLTLADKVSLSLYSVGIYKRGGIKQRHAAETVLKAFSNVALG